MFSRKPEPTTMIIFGATGDLARKKLLPALLRLQTLKLLPEVFNIVGLSTRALSDADYRALAAESLARYSRVKPAGENEIKRLTERIWFVPSAFDNVEGYRRLSEKLSGIDAISGKACNRLFYLATPPSFFSVIIDKLREAGLSARAANHCNPKIVIEKPFGSDLDSARELNNLVLRDFDEDQIYRIDHYLGKETVQNILYFRFANGIYEPIWNRRYVDHVQITAAETIGVEDRGKYFEEAGTLRDMVQNHILQLLTLVAMEPPINMEAGAIRSKKVDLLNSIRHIEPEDVKYNAIRGQYGAGVASPGAVAAYRDEKGVAPDSEIETFVALKVMIDNWRWAGVPFYIRTGKRLRQTITEIAIHFKEVPLSLFTRGIAGFPENNVLVLKIQPDEGITFQFNVKLPGSSSHIEKVTMDFSYSETFKAELPEAYERLILDSMLGDSTLFPHRAGIEASWEFITKMLEGWKRLPPPKFPNYSAGSWGPQESDLLIARDGRIWRNP